MRLPPGSRFGPTELGLVRRYLRNMVERNDSGNITTMDVYKDDPWRLDHVSNTLFKKNEWYYFVPRTKRGTKSANRTVPRRGENQGGTWKTTGKIEPIKDRNMKELGYKQSLVYNKNVNGKQEKTHWLMTEFTLHKDGYNNEFQSLVLCWIRYKENKKINLGFNDAPRVVEEHPQHEQEDHAPQIEEEHQQHEQEDHAPVLVIPPLPPQNNNNDMMINSMLPLPPHDMMMNSMLPLSPQNNNNDMMMNSMLPLPPHNNNNNDMVMNSMLPLPPPYPQGQDSGLHTMNESYDNNLLMNQNDLLMQSYDNYLLMQNHDNNFLVPMSNDEQYPLDCSDFYDEENMTFDVVNEVMQITRDDYTQYEQDHTDPSSHES